MKTSPCYLANFRKCIFGTIILFQSYILFSQTFQTTIGYQLPTNEFGVSGLITNTGDFLILGSNSKHPAGLFNLNGDLQLTWISSSGAVLNPGKIIGHDGIESAIWFEKAIDCFGNPGYIIAANQFGGFGMSNILLTFTNLGGTPLWSKLISSSDAQSVCVKQDGGGNFILIGTKTDMASGMSSVLAIKVDCAGNLIWEKDYRVGLTAVPTSVTAFGTFQTPCPNLPNEYFITGKTIPPPAGSQAIFILSINANTGVTSFLKYYDLAPATDDIPNCIQGFCPSNLVPLGQLFISGYSVDPFDFDNPKKVMMMSTDLSGTLLWANNYDLQTSYREFSTHFQFDANNKIILTGKAEETGVSDPPETGQCLLMRLDNSGSTVDWARIFEMGFSSQGNRVEINKKNEYFIAGHSFTIPVIRQSNYDILAIQTDTQGRTNSSCYRNDSVKIIKLQPVVISANASVTTFQSFAPVVLLNKLYQDKQYYCPFNPCDSIHGSAAFVFSAMGNLVSFSDSSSIGTSNILSWHWDFGDNTTSNNQNPMHAYSSSGIYIVCLIISTSINGQICRDSICRNVEIRSLPGERCDNVMLHASFNYTGNGNSMSFTDLSNINSNFNFLSWHWDFGDGNFSNIQNPVHTYSSLGNYSVCLIVSGGNAVVVCKDTICKTIQVPYQPYDTCLTNIVRNGQFNQGAVAGDLDVSGTSAYWNRWTWSPQVVDFDFCRDSFSMQMWGNQAVGEGMKQAVNFQKGSIYQLSFCGKRLSTPYPNAQALFRASIAPITYLDYDNCQPGACDEIFLSPVLSGNWVSYVSAPWTATQNYDLLTISVWNNFNTLDKAYTSWLRIDDVCIEKIGTVSTEDKSNKSKATVYPNPTNGDAVLVFDEPLTSTAVIQIIDLTGQTISETVTRSGESRFNISLNNFHKGIYFLRVLNIHTLIWNGKLIKE